jgi:hypothetical protein
VQVEHVAVIHGGHREPLRAERDHVGQLPDPGQVRVRRVGRREHPPGPGRGDLIEARVAIEQVALSFRRDLLTKHDARILVTNVLLRGDDVP